jgi:hypothetical protein
MKNIEIEKTVKTPYIKLTSNSLTITGRSYPELAINFYKPIMDSINEVDSFDFFTVYLDFEYLNTSSNKAVSYIIKNIADKTKEVVEVNWGIDEDDESMVDLSESYKSMINNTKFIIEIRYK